MTDTAGEVPVPIEEAQTPEAPLEAAAGTEPVLEPEVAQEEALPPESPPPVYMKKPPVLMAAVSLLVIVLFIAGLAVIFGGGKKNTPASVNEKSPSSAPAARTSSSSSPVKTAVPTPIPKWIPYTALSGNFSLDIPADKTVKFSSSGAILDFCDIGSEEASIRIFADEKAKDPDLTISFAQKNAVKDTADAWVLQHCPEVLGADTEKGVIDEDGVKGVYYVRRYSKDSPGTLPYNLAVLKKGNALSFVYAQGKSDAAMTSLFDPMFLSYKLLAK